MVWSLEGSATLSGARLGPLPSVVGTFPVPFPGAPLVPGAFAIESLGGGLVVAVAARTIQGDHLEVTGFDGTDQPAWSATVPTGGVVEGALSLRASRMARRCSSPGRSWCSGAHAIRIAQARLRRRRESVR